MRDGFDLDLIFMLVLILYLTLSFFAVLMTMGCDFRDPLGEFPLTYQTPLQFASKNPQELPRDFHSRVKQGRQSRHPPLKQVMTSCLHYDYNLVITLMTIATSMTTIMIVILICII